jgi:uncharacterized protein YjbI with pentapeptide repeats
MSSDILFDNQQFENIIFNETPFPIGEYENCVFNNCDLSNANFLISTLYPAHF